MPDLMFIPPEKNLPRRDNRTGNSYRPQLDGLRAIAILFVLTEHFGLALPPLLRYGPLSVRFFFVLSGYFITLSLWKLRDEVENAREWPGQRIASFYFNRLVRIGPPFYLALFVGVVLNIAQVRDHLFWIATFQTNNYIAWLGYWPDSISHFWSLAVQEQFYLLWPAVVFLLPRRFFLPAIGLLIVFGLVYRIGCMMADTSTLMRWVTLFGCADSFAMGALIAYVKYTGLLEQMRHVFADFFRAMPLLAVGCLFFGRALMTLPEGNYGLAFTETVDAIFLAWILLAALHEKETCYMRWLSWGPLVYLGRISYGIYVYHVFIIILLSPWLAAHGLSESHLAFARIGILFLLTIATAALSWHLLEQPCLAWKNVLLNSGRAPRPVKVPARVLPVCLESN